MNKSLCGFLIIMLLLCSLIGCAPETPNAPDGGSIITTTLPEVTQERIPPSALLSSREVANHLDYQTPKEFLHWLDHSEFLDDLPGDPVAYEKTHINLPLSQDFYGAVLLTNEEEVKCYYSRLYQEGLIQIDERLQAQLTLNQSKYEKKEIKKEELEAWNADQKARANLKKQEIYLFYEDLLRVDYSKHALLIVPLYDATSRAGIVDSEIKQITLDQDRLIVQFETLYGYDDYGDAEVGVHRLQMILIDKESIPHQNGNLTIVIAQDSQITDDPRLKHEFDYMIYPHKQFFFDPVDE